MELSTGRRGAVVSTSRATLLTFDRRFRRFRGLDVSILGG